LEETLIDRTFENRRAQPFVQGGAQHRWQVFGGKAPIAIDHADPQVHIILLAWVEMQADQEIGRHLALFPQYLDVGGDQGEAFLIQLPGQARIGLDVLPGLGEDRIQVQGKVLAVHAQFTMAQVATDTAGNVARGRCAEIRIKTHAIKVGGKADFLVGRVLGTEIHQHITQQAGGLEMFDGFGEALR